MEFTKGKLIAIVDSCLIAFVIFLCVWLVPLWLKMESAAYAIGMTLIVSLDIAWFMSEFEE